MMKHLFWYPWIMAALVLGILICLGMIWAMLSAGSDQSAFHAGAQLVMGGLAYAPI